MAFYEDVAEDLELLFFDEEELATQHTLDGTSVLAVVDEDEADRLTRASSDKYLTNAPNGSTLLVFLKEADVEKKLAVNAVVNFDGKNYFVHKMNRQDGVWRLILGRNQI